MYYLYKVVAFNELPDTPSAACVVFEPLRYKTKEDAEYAKQLLDIVSRSDYTVISDEDLEESGLNVILPCNEISLCSPESVYEPDLQSFL